jgi:hypothetical protein
VPADVVDVLEAVEIDGDERERLAGAAGAPECLLDAVVEQRAVRKAGEGIAQSFGVRAVEPPVQEYARGSRDERAEHEDGDDVVGRLAKHRSDEARDDHEGGEHQRPHERAFQLSPP